MTTELQIGRHPDPQHLDPDQITAFAEGALSAPERVLCLEHLAGCARCREIAFVAGAASPEGQRAPAQVPEREPEAGWRRRLQLLGWWPALGGAALAAAGLVGVLLLRPRPVPPPVPPPVQLAEAAAAAPGKALPGQRAAGDAQDRVAASSKPPVKSPPAPRSSIAAAERSHDAAEEASTRTQRSYSALAAHMAGGAAAAAHSAGPVPPPTDAAARPAVSYAAAGSMSAASAPIPPPPAPAPAQGQAAPVAGQVRMTLRAQVPLAQSSAQSSAAPARIAGVVTDRTGAVIPQAAVEVEPMAGAARQQATTDNAGRFAVNAVPPGRYRVQVAAPGFSTQVTEVDIVPGEVAQIDAHLDAGAASETVEVSSDALAPVPVTVSLDGGTLTLTARGQLLLRHGSHATLLAGPWKKARLVALVLTADGQAKVSTAGLAWVSSDGKSWRVAPR